MQSRFIVFGFVATSGLAACGDTLGEQALVGSAVGAGTAVVLDGNPFTGAALGVLGNVAYCQQFPTRC